MSTMKESDHKYIRGNGSSFEDAAVEFVKDMMKHFPSEEGVYNFYLRRPIEHVKERNILSGGENHIIFMRFSMPLISLREKDAFITGFGGVNA